MGLFHCTVRTVFLCYIFVRSCEQFKKNQVILLQGLLVYRWFKILTYLMIGYSKFIMWQRKVFFSVSCAQNPWDILFNGKLFQQMFFMAWRRRWKRVFFYRSCRRFMLEDMQKLFGRGKRGKFTGDSLRRLFKLAHKRPFLMPFSKGNTARKIFFLPSLRKLFFGNSKNLAIWCQKGWGAFIAFFSMPCSLCNSNIF